MTDTTMKRPSGSNADEWHLFLCEYLDDPCDGLAFIAVQIAEAIEAERERCAMLHMEICWVPRHEDGHVLWLDRVWDEGRDDGPWF